MADLQERILDIITKPQLSSLATITADGKPWVRYVMAMADDNLTLRFATFVQARKVTQIAANPEVHLTAGVTSPMDMKPYVQIQGRAVFTTDQEKRHAFWTPMLAPIFDGPDDPKYGVIEMTPYRIELCTPGSYEPEVWMGN
jgi:general stress protein 26